MRVVVAVFVLCFASAVRAFAGTGMTELEIARAELCRFFRGNCRPQCQNYFVHRWGLPLCPNLSYKCCAPDSLTPTRTEAPADAEPTTPTTTISTTEAQCGLQPEVRRRKRIVGGGPAPRGYWPWLVALRSALGPHVCAGAMVSSRYMITAAHCFNQFTSSAMYRVRVGEYDLLETDPSERDINVEEIFIHPSFNRHAGDNDTDYERWSHDIAVVKLAERTDVTPVCLPFDDAEVWALPGNEGSRDQLTAVEAKGDCWVAGWGHTNDDSSDMVLKQVHGTVHDSRHCSQRWNQHIGHDMICFGDGRSGPCGGDSGGPLSCQFEGRYYLTGVVSWGARSCDLHGYPSVFIRILPYLSWLQEIIV